MQFGTQLRFTLFLCATVALSPLTSIGFLLIPPHVSLIAPIQQPQLLKERRYTGENSNTPIAYVATALLGKDGLVYALDQQNSVIHVAEGAKQLRLISRAGRGPGEMQRPNRMAFLSDSIALPDASLSRVTIFALGGKSIRTIDIAVARASGFYGVDPIAYGRSSLVMMGWNNAGRGDDLSLFLRRHGRAKLDTLAHLIRKNVRMDVPALLRGQPLEWTVEDARGHLLHRFGLVDDAPAIDTWRY